LIHQGAVEPFADALRFVLALSGLGWPLAAASSSKNADPMMKRIAMGDGRMLFDMFTANDCGRDFAHGKPDPAIFLTAAASLGVAPAHCVVVEDSPAGIVAARAGGMAGLGVARLDDAAGLRAAGATLVVTSLDEVDMALLAQGQLRRGRPGRRAA
jgi:beta-phosphoglucomutase-like phosphatase (HAD superfamily)